METREFTAFDISNNDDIGCYLTVINAKEICALSTILRADSDNGYQRLLNDNRVKDITKYLNEGNIIPGSIILSAQSGSMINFDKASNKLKLDNAHNNKLFIIDGQHRVYGAANCDKDILLPVCIFNNLSLEQEVQYFLDINSNQKGVPKTLRIELLKFLSEPDSKDDIRIRLFKELGEDPNSPLYQKTSLITSASGKITHVPFQAALDPILDNNILKSMDYLKKKNLILNYLNAVNRVLNELGENKRLLNSAFFQAIFKIFDQVCSLSLIHYQNYREDSLYHILLGIKTIDFDKHGGSNQQTISNMSAELAELLNMNSAKLTTPDDLLF